MLWNVRHMGRVAILLLYAIYALTPIHLCAMEGDGNGGGARLLAGKHSSTDIVWVNVLFSSLINDDAPSGDAQEGDDVVLVRKRRAVLREHVLAKPLHETEDLPPTDSEQGSQSFHEYELTKRPAHQDTDGYLALNTGLSPPVSFF